MENDEQDVEFNSTLEPDIIINDGSAGAYEDHQKNNLKNNISSDTVPNVSFTPYKKKHQTKVRFHENGMTPDKQENKVQRQRSPRQPVRLISRDEAIRAEITNTSIKRKSLPLEKCPICKKYFRRMKTHLQKHEEVRRDPNDPLTCQFCMKVFNTGSNLSIHMRTHTGDKPYRCDICSKGFAQSCNLVNHMRIHTGERPFKCPHCERAFTQSGNLSNHVRLHTDEKPFRCHFCDKAFTQSGNLNSHIRNNHKFLDSMDAGLTNPVMNNSN